MRYQYEAAKIVPVLDAQGAGATNVNTAGVQMDGYNALQFVCHLGALTATQQTAIKLQQSDDNGATDAYADLAGSQTDFAADADSNKVLVVEVREPVKRWVRAVVVRGTANAVIQSVVAYAYDAKKEAVVQDAANVSQFKLVAGPDEGSAT